MTEGKKAEKTLRDFAMSYPSATEDFPWDHIAIKVKKKAFLFLGGGANPNGFSMTVKLPFSNQAALMFHFAEPAGYGLGKAGWVTASLGAKEKPPIDLLKLWVDESYRAVAPKTLLKELASPARPQEVKRAAPKKPKPASRPSR